MYRWNGKDWINLKTTNGSINAIAFDNRNPQYLYVGGTFTNFTNCNRYTRTILPTKKINIDTNTYVYNESFDKKVSSIVLKDMGESVTINATGSLGFITNISSNSYITYQ